MPPFRLLLVALVIAMAMVASLARADRLTVFAAASTKTALDAVASAFMDQTETRVAVSYAGSSALARQIQLGAPADVFLSANVEWMDAVEDTGVLVSDTRQDLLGNRLVLIGTGPAGDPLDVQDVPEALGQGRLAIAFVSAVPAGIYGQAALDTLGLWDRLEPRVVQTDNARSALALVALGEAAMGVVYATDAEAEPRVHVKATFPNDSHPQIRYPVARLNDRPASRAFFAYLTGPEARDTFRAHGFRVMPE